MKRSAIFASCIGGAVILGCILLWLPEWMANQYRFADAKDWAAQVTSNRTLLTNLLGGSAVALTIYFTYANFKIAQDNLKLTESRLSIELFSKSVEQLGNVDLSVRLGGIMSLARIARASQPDYLPIMQIVTGYLRNRYGTDGVSISPASTLPGRSHCPVEAQAILTIVGERHWELPEDYALDLSYIRLSDAWVPRADFHDVYFWDVELARWNFAGTKLQDADFKGACLVDCVFTGADLTNANFEDASITGAIGLTAAQLSSAINVDPVRCLPS